MPDIGIWMRPDVPQRKRGEPRASWYLRDGSALRTDEPEEFRVKPGDHLWVSVTDKWVGYFTIAAVRPETFEVEWERSSRRPVDYPLDWPNRFAHVNIKRELRGGYTSHVPELPLPDLCSKCAGPVYRHDEYPRERRCWGCHSGEEHCTCNPVASSSGH